MKQINTYYSDEEQKKLVERASKIIGLKTSAFVRMVCLEKSKQIIKENSAEVQPIVS